MLLTIITSLLCCILFIPESSGKDCDGATAFIINGSNPKSDDCSFYTDMDNASKTLKNFKCQVTFGLKDKRTKNKCSGPGPYEKGKEADYKVKYKVIVKQIEEHAKKLNGKPFVLYFTDHGGYKNNQSTVSLGFNSISVEKQRELLKIVQKHSPESKIITINDHCFSGGMIDATFDKNNKLSPLKNTCGFSAASRYEYSYNGEGFINTLKSIKNLDPVLLDTTLDRNLLSIKNKLKKNNGKLNFHQLFQIHKIDGATNSAPMSSSELFLKQYFEIKNVKKRTADNSFTHNFHQTILQCYSKQYAGNKGVKKFTQLANSPIFKNLIDEMVTNLEITRKKLRYDRSKLSFSTIDSLIKKQEKTLKELLDNQNELKKKIRHIVRNAWRHTKEYDKLKVDLVNYTGNKNLDAYINMKERYYVLAKNFDNVWKTRNSIEQVDKLGKKIQQKSEEIEMMNYSLNNFRTYHSTLVNLNSLKHMAKTGDIESLNKYMDIIDCENTIAGNF